MDPGLVLTGFVILAAIGFDFVNGFHDAANSIATIVATRILSPRKAVLWAAFFNFAGLFIFGTGVAATVGSGMIRLETVTEAVLLSALTGALIWGVITWFVGFPTSSTHALLGGYAGAAMTNNILHRGWGAAYDSVIVSGWIPTLVFIVVAPTLGIALGHLLMKATMSAFAKGQRMRNDLWFGRLQLFSSAFLSLMHGGNDAQKTAGIITGALVTGRYIDHFTVPLWVLVLCYLTMALGTFLGGWRIIHTMGQKLTRLTPLSGFCAESAAALSILLATILHLPVSTTHATTGAIAGVGAARRLSSVRWRLFGRIAWAWVFTIPISALLGAGFMWIAFTLLE